MKKLNLIIIFIFTGVIFMFSLDYEVIFYKPTVDNLRLRETPDLNGKVITKVFKKNYLKFIKEGEKIVVDNIAGNWMQINYNFQKGWCFSGYLEKVIYKISIPDKTLNDLVKNYNSFKKEGFHNLYSYKDELLWQVSPSNKYIFITTMYAWKHPDNEDEINKKCWYMIYDIKSKKTINKGTGFVIFGSLKWLENIGYLLYDMGEDIPRNYVFFNLNKPKPEFIISEVAIESDQFDYAKNLFYTKDLRYFAAKYWEYFDQGISEKKLKKGVKVYDAELDKTYVFTTYDSRKKLSDYVNDIKK